MIQFADQGIMHARLPGLIFRMYARLLSWCFFGVQEPAPERPLPYRLHAERIFSLALGGLVGFRQAGYAPAPS